jgi:diguanylate cyclase (GGDEF)-like protein/PAS domain S-box-containing protein
VVAPLLILWGADPRPRWGRRPALELALLTTCLTLTGFAIFGGLLPAGHPLSFLSIPPLLWAAFRFRPREAATATALLSGIAIWGALHGFGPFVSESPNQSLLLLQAFMGVMSVTNLAVAAAVSQRRRAEEALSRTAAIVDSSQDAIIGKTLDGTILSWNHGAERLYGYSAEEAVGRNVSILAPRDRPDETPQILEKLRRGESVEHFETVRARQDGRKVTISLRVSPIRDARGRIAGASAIARDITQRKRAEAHLVTQSAVTRVLTESNALRDAAPRLLETVCEGLGWEVGELWRAEADTGPLRCEMRWPHPVDRSGDGGPSPASDLAARVFASGRALLIGDPSGRPRRLRPAGINEEGLREAAAVPVRAGGRVVGVLAFCSHEAHRSTRGLLETLGDIGSRIGQFIERERALAGLRRLEKAVETIEMGVTITDMTGRILYTNPAEAELHGYRVEELIGRPVSVFMPAAWRPAAGQPPEIQSWRRETVNLRRDGTIFPVQLLSDAVTDTDGTPLGIVTCCEEITERKRAEQALRSSETRYRLLFERNLAGVYRATLAGRILECNDAFARVLGYPSREEVLSRTAGDLFFRPEDRERSLAHLREKGTLTNFELRMRRKDGTSVWVLENQTLLKGQKSEEDLVEGTLIDITDRKLAAERVEFHAYHDPLTGLPNRMHLRDRMHPALAQARRSGRGLAVMFLDLDHFKVVNDTLGHAVGDRLLQEVAGRLKECVREDDMVARVGGDEFILLLPSVGHAEGAARIARKLLDRVEEVFDADGHELSVTTSVGIALFPQHGDDEETLLRNADAAMYRAKELGRNGYQFCDAATGRLVSDRMALQERLGHALERGEISLAYQPQVELRSGRIVGVEALLRWHDPQKGAIPPAEFVPLAEETGAIVRLGEWALEQACRQGRAWQEQGLPALRVAVNVSVRQLWQPDLKGSVSRILEETSLDPRHLDLEITETTAMQNFDLTAPILRDFAAMGIGITIDDFGTGYSSLSYLKLLPVQRLKIDRSLVAGITRDRRDLAIVKAVVRLAHSLGLAVVAEGVETEEQKSALKRIHCDEMQGWIFSEAVSEERFARLLSAPPA